MSATDIPDDILEANSRSIATEGVASQVALMSVFSLVTVIAFNLLRPNNKIIYEPKVKYHEGAKPPPRISDSIFGWLPPLVHTKEPELVEKIGLDATTFLRFNRLMRWLFTGIAALTCGVLLPINYIYNKKNLKQGKEDPDLLTMLTIRDVKGDLLYAHVAASYLITIGVCVFLYIHWNHMIRLRHQWFRSPEYLQSFYARTLAITHVPKSLKSDDGIAQIFQSVRVPYPTTSVHIGRKVGQLPELIAFHNETVREFEQVLVKYLKGGRLAKRRPTIRVGGTCGCGGVTKDAIQHYTAKLKRTEAAIEDYRRTIDTHKAENYGFASMAAVPYAHIVARQLSSKHPKGTNIALAPNPKDIIWENMNKSDSELARKRIHGSLWLAFICFMNTIPLLIISVLANLDALAKYVKFLLKWKAASNWTFVVVSGVLPPAISGIFGFFLPIIMRWLTRYMGALTHSKLDRAVVARYFFFLIISQLVIFTLLGVIFKSGQEIVREIGDQASLQEIVNALEKLPATINRTYIDQASYWLTFFPLRGFLVVFDLAQIINLVWISIKTHLFGRTPRDIREWTQPPEFEYAVYYSNILFMCAVGLVFAPLAPLVALAAAVVFWMSSVVYKYQLMFVFVSKVETGGRIWNVIMNRILVSLILMQLLMVLTIGLQFGFRSFRWIAAIPPIIFVIAFKLYTNRVFLPRFNYYIPTEDELRTAKVHSERADAKGNRLEKRFGHPSLHADLFTPMLHAKMMPLLSQVYSGKIGRQQTKLDEYGGQKMDAQVIEGGIKIAAIDQRDLEYDPAMYRRDRGELDWDARSMASTNYLNDAASTMQPGFSQFGDSTTSLIPGYDRYMNQGPHGVSQEQFELSRIDSAHEPLINSRQSSAGIPLYPPTMHHDNSSNMSREAPIHRPQQLSAGAYPPSAYSAASPVESPGLSPFSSGTGHSPLLERGSSPFMERTSSPVPRQASPYLDRTGTPVGHYQQPQSSSQFMERTGTPVGHHQDGSLQSMGYHQQSVDRVGTPVGQGRPLMARQGSSFQPQQDRTGTPVGQGRPPMARQGSSFQPQQQPYINQRPAPQRQFTSDPHDQRRQQQSPGHSPQASDTGNGNMAGRGAHRY